MFKQLISVLGLGEHTTTKQHGDLLRIDPVVFGFATVHCLHGEGVSEHTGNTLAGAKVCEPRPGAKALDSDDNIVPIGRNGLEKRLWAGWHVTMKPSVAVLVEDTGIHHSGL